MQLMGLRISLVSHRLLKSENISVTYSQQCQADLCQWALRLSARSPANMKCQNTISEDSLKGCLCDIHPKATHLPYFD